MKINLRIENDKGITKLLKKHKKYYLEYKLNVYSQGYENRIRASFAPLLFNLAISQIAVEFMHNSLKEAKII